MSQQPSEESRRPDVDAIIADYLERVDRGEQVDHDYLLGLYPEFADILDEFFSAEKMVYGSALETAGFQKHPTPRNALRIRCPHCRTPTDIAIDTPVADIRCECCGGQFTLAGDSRRTQAASTMTTVGHFELIERLGMGGFGTVWKARDTELDRAVAVKIPRRGQMDADETEKVLREARAVAQLKHPNIVSVHEVGREGDTLYIVSDLIRGVTLDDWLTGQRPTGREAAELCAKIAMALQHAHECGIIHRDLKPANIMIDGDGEPHLMDFGLARREVGEVTITIDGQLLGTPAYMSPEQALGQAHLADRRTDVYSLGVILFQLLTGELPFRGNVRMLMHQVINDQPPSPRSFNANVSRDLETITLKCLQKDSQLRYATAEDVSDELQRFLQGAPIAARPVSKIDRTLRWCRRHPAVTSSIAAAAALAMLLCYGAYEYNGRLHARTLTRGLLEAQEEVVFKFVDQLSPYLQWARPVLEEAAAKEPKSHSDERQRLHARLALVRANGAYASELKDALLESSAVYTGLICEALRPYQHLLVDDLWTELHSKTTTSERRFRAGMALANYVPTAEQWHDDDYRFLAEQLLQRNPEDQPIWRTYLQPVAASCLPHWERVFSDASSSETQCLGAANALAEFAAHHQQRIARLLTIANPAQYAILFPLIAQSTENSLATDLAEMAATLPTDNLSSIERVQFGRQRAGAGITLLRLGLPEAVFPTFNMTDDPEAITQFIHGCLERNVAAGDLLECLVLVNQRAAAFSGRRGMPEIALYDHARYALLLALAEYHPSAIPAEQRERLLEIVSSWYAHDPAAGVHGAAGWLLRKWGKQAVVTKVDQTPMAYSLDREWFTIAVAVTSSPAASVPRETLAGNGGHQQADQMLYLTFVVFPPGEYLVGTVKGEYKRVLNETRHTVKMTRPFAVLDRELTFAELIAFDRRFVDTMRQTRAHLDSPACGMTWYDAVNYCRWLSELAGVDEEEQAYLDRGSLQEQQIRREHGLQTNTAPENWPVRLERRGFRLPTEAEWEIACRGGSRTRFGHGEDLDLLQHYAWYAGNSGEDRRPPKSRRPGRQALYDMHGSLLEWCHDWFGSYERGTVVDDGGPEIGRFRVFRGGSRSRGASHCRSAYRFRNEPEFRNGDLGFRLAVVPSSEFPAEAP